MVEKFEFINAKSSSVTTEEVVVDLKRVADLANNVKLTRKAYDENGAYNSSTVVRRFGTWNKALASADLETSNQLNITEEELFKNILLLWEHLGHQPRRADLTNNISLYSQYPYNRHFKSWNNALKSFVTWANTEEIIAPEAKSATSNQRKTGRDPSLRLRFRVMQRDNFSCKQCGASPAKNSAVELHIDHVTPWSKGGDTIYENLQTLCSKCNYGKSNLV